VDDSSSWSLKSSDIRHLIPRWNVQKTAGCHGAGFYTRYVFIVLFMKLLLVALTVGSHGLVLLAAVLSVAGVPLLFEWLTIS